MKADATRFSKFCFYAELCKCINVFYARIYTCAETRTWQIFCITGFQKRLYTIKIICDAWRRKLPHALCGYQVRSLCRVRSFCQRNQKRNFQIAQINKHNHCEVFSENTLGYIKYINSVVGTFCTDFGDNSAGVTSCYCNNGFHWVISSVK